MTVLSLLLVSSLALAQEATPPAAPAAPTTPAPQEEAAQPPRPFPEGAKVAYINIQRIASESAEGRASTARVQALNEQKVAEITQQNQQLQELQQKLQQGLTVMSATARAELQREIERLQVEIQRATEDAQLEVQDLQTQLQEEFQRRLVPVIREVAEERGLHFVLSQIDAGIVWADSGLDVTEDVIQRFDSATSGPAQPEEPQP